MKEKLLRILLITCFLVLLASNCFATARIAILSFGNHSGLSASDGIYLQEEVNSVVDYVTEGFTNSGRFEVIEREALPQILNEQALSTTGVINPNTAVKLGNVMGVRYIVYGNITNVSAKESEAAYSLTNNRSAFEAGSNIKTVRANISGRIIDVETGRIAFAATGKGASTSTLNNIGVAFTSRHGRRYTNHEFKIGSEKISQESVDKAFEKASYDLVNNLLDRIEGKKGKGFVRR